MNSLLEAILLPSSFAICKCSAHTGQLDAISQLGNSAVDLAAKAAASAPPNTILILTLLTQPACSADTETPLATIQDCQAGATPQEKANWKRDGTYSDGVWLGPSGKPCLLCYLFPYYVQLTHGREHVSKGGMVSLISEHWDTCGFSIHAKFFFEKSVL